MSIIYLKEITNSFRALSRKFKCQEKDGCPSSRDKIVDFTNDTSESAKFSQGNPPPESGNPLFLLAFSFSRELLISINRQLAANSFSRCFFLEQKKIHPPHSSFQAWQLASLIKSTPLRPCFSNPRRLNGIVKEKIFFSPPPPSSFPPSPSPARFLGAQLNRRKKYRRTGARSKEIIQSP